jgi:hypothetical protein
MGTEYDVEPSSPTLNEPIATPAICFGLPKPTAGNIFP